MSSKYFVILHKRQIANYLLICSSWCWGHFACSCKWSQTPLVFDHFYIFSILLLKFSVKSNYFVYLNLLFSLYILLLIFTLHFIFLNCLLSLPIIHFSFWSIFLSNCRQNKGADTGLVLKCENDSTYLFTHLLNLFNSDDFYHSFVCWTRIQCDQIGLNFTTWAIFKKPWSIL